MQAFRKQSTYNQDGTTSAKEKESAEKKIELLILLRGQDFLQMYKALRLPGSLQAHRVIWVLFSRFFYFWKMMLFRL